MRYLREGSDEAAWAWAMAGHLFGGMSQGARPAPDSGVPGDARGASGLRDMRRGVSNTLP